jgi:hypothetical protein
MTTEMPTLSWKTDASGRPEHALYYNNLCVGSLIFRPLLFQVDGRRHTEGPWQGWFHCREDYGASTGWYATKEEAQASVEAAFWAAIKDVSE